MVVPMNILIFDVGTSHMKGSLMDETGKVLCRRDVKYQPVFLSGGYVEQRPEDWANALVSICADISPDWTVDAIALTAQRSSVIPVDGAGIPLRPAIMWQDTRNSELCKSLKQHDKELTMLCGSPVNTVFSGGKMAWLRNNEPGLYAKAAKLIVVPDYLIWLMTGRYCTDTTYGSRSLLMDLKTKQWSPELLELFHIGREKLCELTQPGEVVGSVTVSFSKKTGITAGIPVISSGGDQQCGSLGQGVIARGNAAVTLGTGAYLTAVCPDVPENLSGGLVCGVSAMPDQYILESNVLTCCGALDWFLSRYPQMDYTALTQALAQSTPGANGVRCLPYFQGRSAPDWNSDARGCFWGISLSTTTEDLLRALMEGICFELDSHLSRMADYTAIQTISANGGLTRCTAFDQLQADVYGLEVVTGEHTEATTDGAWMNAVVALGVYENQERAWIGLRSEHMRRYQPNPALHRKYDTYKKQMTQMYLVMNQSET